MYVFLWYFIGVNIYKVGFWAVCVAAVTALSACSGPTEEVSASNIPSEVFIGNKPPLENEPGADGKDYLSEWSSGETDPDVEVTCNKVGLQYCSFPTDEVIVNQDYITLAALGARCYVAFTPVGADYDNGNLSMVIFSRFNRQLQTGTWDLPLADFGKVIDSYRSLCRA
jgi:hypothetical protein